MAAARDQHNLDPGRMRPPERLQIAIRNVKLRVQQRPINIGRQQSYGRGKRHSNDGTIRRDHAIWIERGARS